MIGKLGLLIGTVGLCSSLGTLVHAQAIDPAKAGLSGFAESRRHR